MVLKTGSTIDGDMVGKRELCRSFGCSERTIQRMVKRFEIPPPIVLAARKYWNVGRMRLWLSDRANRAEADARASKERETREKETIKKRQSDAGFL